jgi:putative Mn2+ efflux pump MntP
MLYGLILANLIDLDHIFYRIIGKVGWFESACPHIGMQCSFGFYPLHTIYVFITAIVLVLASGIFLLSRKLSKHKKNKEHQESKQKKNVTRLIFLWIFWISLGVIIHFSLDYLSLIIGFGI